MDIKSDPDSTRTSRHVSFTESKKKQNKPWNSNKTWRVVWQLVTVHCCCSGVMFPSLQLLRTAQTIRNPGMLWQETVTKSVTTTKKNNNKTNKWWREEVKSSSFICEETFLCRTTVIRTETWTGVDLVRLHINKLWTKPQTEQHLYNLIYNNNCVCVLGSGVTVTEVSIEESYWTPLFKGLLNSSLSINYL